MSEILKKILVILLIAIIFISYASNTIQAVYEITEAYIEKIGVADYHLKYYNEELGMDTYSICSIVGHYEEGTFYPAYCLNRELNGVGTVENYTVDIDSLMENEQIWRAVKNGYPYKSANEMGLASDFDAFAVTKFAVYCLNGQADINLYSADEEDSEGQAMLRALHNLVDIGLNGQDKFTNEIEIVKAGDLVEDGEYYSIAYKVKSGATISKYNIKSVSGISEGDLITDINGNIRTTFNSEENFKIKIAKANLNSDKNIKIEIEAELKNYPMFYGKTRISGTQNYLLTGASYHNISTSVSENLKLNQGKIIVNKIDKDNRKGISDTEISLYNSNNEVIATKLTDENGKIEFLDLYQGDYILKETKTNEAYVLGENVDYPISVNYNEVKTIDIENEHKKGNLVIYKVDKDYKYNLLSNVGFEIYSEETGELVGVYYTDSNGKIEVENLRIGKYKIKEFCTNDNYSLASDEEVQILWNETTEITIENELKKGQIKITKVDGDNPEIKIPDVEFEIINKKGLLVDKLTTDKNGEAISKRLPIYTAYKIVETKANDKYVKTDEEISVLLSENEVTNVIVENKKIEGQIKVIKTASNTSQFTGIKKGEPIEGVIFEIYDFSGKVVETITTDSQGIAISNKLEKGLYKVKEKSVGDGYLLDNNYYEIEIQTDNQIEELELENTPAIPNGSIEKIGPDEASPNEEIEYKISVKNTGNVPLNDFIWEDEIPTDYIKVTKINLGTYNQKNTYNLYYKTNFSEDYILLLEDIDTLKSEMIEFSEELAENEYITNIKLDFGKVDVDFKSEVETSIYAKVNSDVKSEDTFENKVTLKGRYKSFNFNKASRWKTIVYKLLPLTGK